MEAGPHSSSDEVSNKNNVGIQLGKYLWRSHPRDGKNTTISLQLTNAVKKKMKGLEHPNIISFSPQSFLHDGKTYLPSKFRMDMGNCSHLLNTFYPEGFPELAINLIAKNVLKALAYLHQEGIIHRAICAENVLLDSDGQIRIAITQHAIQIKDCPRWLGQSDKVHNFTELEPVFAWLAPEVLGQDLNGYGIQSDIYSFGICLCELANGLAPFFEMEPLQILYEKLRGTTPFLLDPTTCDARNRKEFTPTLHEITNESLKHEPEERLSAQQMLQKYADSLFSYVGTKLAQALPHARRLF